MLLLLNQKRLTSDTLNIVFRNAFIVSEKAATKCFMMVVKDTQSVYISKCLHLITMDQSTTI